MQINSGSFMGDKSSCQVSGDNFAARKMGETSTLTVATTETESLRITIPQSIIKQFGLTEYDKLKDFKGRRRRTNNHN